jgi:predicted DsbA family dithiol-disulfide isomerase
MHERLFRAYFTEGRNIGDHGTLVELATEAGLAAVEAADVLASGRFAEDVRRDIDEALQLGINGVPFFVFDGRYAVSGAQDVEVFLDVLGKAGG